MEDTHEQEQHQNQIPLPPNNEQRQFERRIDLHPISEAVSQIKKEISKIIVGQDRVIDLLLVAILSDGHVLLEGVPGVAKTLIAKLLAKTISVDFSRIQFTPDLMPSDVTGTTIFQMNSSTFKFKPGPIFTNIVLIDEINRAPAKTQAALFEVMEEHQITQDGTTYQLDEPFVVIATQNPVEQEGTYQLPEAQHDRFIFKIKVDYPTAQDEFHILQRFNNSGPRANLSAVQPVISADQLAQAKALIKNVRIDDNLLQYIVDIVELTRTSPELYLGASPRASLAIMNSSKAFAALQGRDFVTPEDIQFVTPSVLIHRIILSAEKELDGSTAEEVIQKLMKRIEVPR